MVQVPSKYQTLPVLPILKIEWLSSHDTFHACIL